MGYEIVGHFQDRYSAKNFDRPEFQRMLTQIRSRKLKSNLLLCVSVDRFSRNTEGSLAMVKELNKLGIEFNTTEQNIDYSTPESLLLRLIHYALPQIDNDKRSKVITEKMCEAQKQGRCRHTAPKGYSNLRGDKDNTRQ